MKERPRIVRHTISQAALERVLRSYETKYHMNSKEFYKKYNRGELGDNEDFVKWAGYFVMAVRCGFRDLVPA